MRELLHDDPFTLAAVIDFVRQGWDGRKLPATEQIAATVSQRAKAMKADALEDMSRDVVAAAVRS